MSGSKDGENITWVDKTVNWFKDHKIWGRVIFACMAIFFVLKFCTTVLDFKERLVTSHILADNSKSSLIGSINHAPASKIVSKVLVARFSGDVGNLPAVFDLTLDYQNSNAYGSYFYPSHSKVIYKLAGEIFTDNKIELTEYTGGKITATCKLTSSDGKCFTGEMFNKDKRKFSMHFCTLTEERVKKSVAELIYNTIEKYNNDVDNHTFSASRYFAPNVERFFNMLNTTPDKITDYVNGEYYKEFKGAKSSLDKQSLSVISTGNDEYTADIMMYSTWYKVKEQKQYTNFKTRMEFKFDEKCQIKSVQQFYIRN